MHRVYALVGLSSLVLLVGASYAFNHRFTRTPDTASVTVIPMTSLALTSPAFSEGGAIPSQYTCDASTSTNPPLTISGVPEGARSLVLIVDDPDVPKQLKPDGLFVHWVLFNIPTGIETIGEGEAPGVSGVSSAGDTEYVPPCPPPNYEPPEHRYVFTLYALDAELALRPGASKDEVLSALEGHVLDEAKLVGRYRRQ